MHILKPERCHAFYNILHTTNHSRENALAILLSQCDYLAILKVQKQFDLNIIIVLITFMSSCINFWQLYHHASVGPVIYVIIATEHNQCMYSST